MTICDESILRDAVRSAVPVRCEHTTRLVAVATIVKTEAANSHTAIGAPVGRPGALWYPARFVKLALVSSVGGHLTEALELCRSFADWERFWIINDYSPVLPDDERAYRISHQERDWRVVWNVAEAAAIFAREKPDLMVSTGAGLAVSAALVARAMGTPVIYVEPSSAVTRLTLTGRLMRVLSNRFYVQWESLLKVAPWAKYEGGLI